MLIITGTMGAGKTSVLAEASDLLAARHIVHAAIDLDALGLAHLQSTSSNDRVMYDNLRSVCSNYAALGVRRFVFARALEDDAQLRLCREILPAADTRVCRLTASLETMKQRVATRETGMLRAEFVDRVEKLNALLDRARLEDFTVLNENRPLTEVALELLARADWLSP